MEGIDLENQEETCSLKFVNDTTLTFKTSFDPSSWDCETYARSILTELNGTSGVMDCLGRSQGPFIENAFSIICMMAEDNLTDETVNLISSIVPKIMEKSLWLKRRWAKGLKFLYYSTKMYFQQSVIPEEVWTNLHEHGRQKLMTLHEI